MLTPILLLPFVMSAPTEDPTEDPALQELFDADLAFCAETRERGRDGWLAWFAPDAVLMNGEGELVRGGDELRAHFEAAAWPAPGLGWAPEAGALSSDGAFGYTIGGWTIDGSPATGRYLTVWRKTKDGRWLVVSDAGGRQDHRTSLPGPEAPARLTYEDAERLESGDGEVLASLVRRGRRRYRRGHLPHRLEARGGRPLVDPGLGRLALRRHAVRGELADGFVLCFSSAVRPRRCAGTRSRR